MTNALNDPAYIADLLDLTQGKRALGRKWNVHPSSVQRHRDKLTKKDGLPTAEKVAKIVESESREEDSSGNITMSKRADRIIPLSEWLAALKADGFNPADYNTSHGHSIWGQQPREGELVTLYANKFSATKKNAKEIAAADGKLTDEDVVAARKRVQAWKLPQRIPGSGLGEPVAAVLNLADIQGGKSEGGGVRATEQRLYDGLENFQRWVNRQRAAGRNIDEIAIVNNGDPYEGCAGNYASQMFTVELNHRGQMNFVLDVWESYARELFPQYDKAQFISVLCNHTEMGRMGTNKNQTGDSDSGGAFLAESLQRILAGRPEFDHLKFTIPHDEMNVFSTVAGVEMGFNHGHKIPGSDAMGFEKWLNGQVRGDARAYNARVWVTAHRHNYQCFDLGSTTVFQAPSADGGSKWLRDMTGKFSRSGILALLVGKHDPMGWSDPAFL